MTKKDELATVGETAVVPESMKEFVGVGLEHIGKDDMLVPRLALAQGLSPQIMPDKPEYIENLKPGEAFNTVTKEIYGTGPWDIAIVRADPPRWIEFRPRSDGGGVLDLDVPYNDPRVLWTRDDDGKSVQPQATNFYDFVIVMMKEQEIIAISFKSTGIKIAKEMNYLLKIRQAKKGVPFFQSQFSLKPASVTNAKGSFYQFQFKSAGYFNDEAVLEKLKDTYMGLKGKDIKIDRDGSDEEAKGDDDVPF